MTQNVLELAKRGNPQAIAALMNHHLQPKGITARTQLKDKCLRIVLESEQVPDEQIMTTFIQKGLTALGASSITKVKIFGQQTGDGIPAWSRDFELTRKLEPSVSVHQTQPIDNGLNCPKCGSVQIVASKKGFGVGKAAVGAVLLGPLGLAGGMVGSNQLLLSCMQCGHQWEPRKQAVIASENYLNHRMTSTTVKMMGIWERIGVSVLAFSICGFFGIVLLAIPIIGWIAGFFLLLVAVGAPYQYISGNREFISKLVGNCPHCNKKVEINSGTQSFKCSHCQQTIYVRERKFHTI